MDAFTASNGSGRGSRLAHLVAAFVLAGLCAIAGAATAEGDGGGTAAPKPPRVKDVTCDAGCLDIRKVAVGGTITVSGRHLENAESVTFKAESGPRATAPARRVKKGSLRAKVPGGAASGRVRVVTRAGEVATAPVALEVVPAAKLEQPAGFEVERTKATPRKSFFKGRRKSTVNYLFKARGPADVRIDVISKKRKKVVDTVVRRDQEPFQRHSVSWNGLNAKRRIASNGRYRFRVKPLSGEGRGAGAGFRYYDHIFPLRAKRHQYGDGLGAGRGHQGQDVFARCGAPIVAARGGKVQVKAYHYAAGYYVVIDGAKTGKDYVYMHMLRKGRPKLGSRVRTGQRIGYVSDTGRATGCHLHFELWSAPGWYEGGHPLSPTKPLKKWDRWS